MFLSNIQYTFMRSVMWYYPARQRYVLILSSCKPSETKIIVEIFCLEFYENSFYCGCKDSEFLNALSVLLPTFSNLGNKIWSKKYPQLTEVRLTSWCKSDQFNFFFPCHLSLDYCQNVILVKKTQKEYLYVAFKHLYATKNLGFSFL